MVTRLDRILSDKRALLLSVTEGLTHGPDAFTLATVDPTYLFRIAHEGNYTGIVVNPGLAEKYGSAEFREIPMIVMLNGWSAHHDLDPRLAPFCTVERAVKLGAQAVGFVLTNGGPLDPATVTAFGTIVEHAHDYGIPVVAFTHHHEMHSHAASRDAAAARLALELGADAVTTRFTGDHHAFEWLVKCAGRAAVIAIEPPGVAPHDILTHASGAMRAGATGMCYGKAVWHHVKPFSLTRAIQGVVQKDKSVDEALKYLA